MPALLTLSIYDLHHIIGRFVWLYKRVQVVSDCMVFTCSVLCCQCFALLPENRELDKGSSHEGYMFISQHAIDAGKAGGDLRTNKILNDFSPKKEDSEEIQTKCLEILKKVNISEDVKNDLDKLNAIQIEKTLDSPKAVCFRTVQGDMPAVHSTLKSKLATESFIVTS